MWRCSWGRLLLQQLLSMQHPCLNIPNTWLVVGVCSYPAGAPEPPAPPKPGHQGGKETEETKAEAAATTEDEAAAATSTPSKSAAGAENAPTPTPSKRVTRGSSKGGKAAGKKATTPAPSSNTNGLDAKTLGDVEVGCIEGICCLCVVLPSLRADVVGLVKGDSLSTMCAENHTIVHSLTHPHP